MLDLRAELSGWHPFWRMLACSLFASISSCLIVIVIDSILGEMPGTRVQSFIRATEVTACVMILTWILKPKGQLLAVLLIVAMFIPIWWWLKLYNTGGAAHVPALKQAIFVLQYPACVLGAASILFFIRRSLC